MKNAFPVLLTILIAGIAGFALGRSLSSLDARMAASGAARAIDAAGGECAAVARDAWAAPNMGSITVEARTFGSDCAQTVAVLTLRDQAGALLYQDVFPARDLFGPAAALSAGAQRVARALGDWIKPGQGPIISTQSLPDWPDGAEGPTGEFPFLPEAWLDRETYNALQREDVPTFCFAQGMESMRCLIIRDDRVVPIGLQRFPG